MSQARQGEAVKVLTANRRAGHDYTILEKIEAGIALLGPEVKSIRAGEVSLNESFAEVGADGAWLRDFHINPYVNARNDALSPVRPRQLLLHRHEIERLVGQVTTKGRTLIPLRLYLKHGRVKVELALCVGRKTHDKRAELKRREADKETRRALRGA